ncbi:MAG TPA: hypothetical protein VMH23_10535, partial [Bacteroidota bacterium]|nr:hypothetical protein [Bacteroidota bacterium]
MISNRPAFRLLSVLFLLCFIFIPARAGKTPVRIRIGEKTGLVTGYDSSGVVFISVQDLSSALSVPCVSSPERHKIEMRLPNHRLKATAGSPFLVVTDIITSVSSVYQGVRSTLLLDSLYYVPAAEIIGLLERLSPRGLALTTDEPEAKKPAPAASSPFDITGLSLEQRLNGYLLTIKVAHKLTTFDAFLSADSWLYVTVNDAVADTEALSRFKPGDAIRRVLVFQSPTSVQLTFQVSPEIVQVDPLIDPQTSDLLVALHTRTESPKKEDTISTPMENVKKPVDSTRAVQKVKPAPPPKPAESKTS